MRWWHTIQSLLLLLLLILQWLFLQWLLLNDVCRGKWNIATSSRKGLQRLVLQIAALTLFTYGAITITNGIVVIVVVIVSSGGCR